MNSKFFNVRIKDWAVIFTFVAIVFLGKLPSDVFTAFIPSEFGIFVHKDFVSSETSYELLVSTNFRLLMKSLWYIMEFARQLVEDSKQNILEFWICDGLQNL